MMVSLAPRAMELRGPAARLRRHGRALQLAQRTIQKPPKQESAMSRKVTIKGKDGSFGAYVADGKTRGGPAIVVIQEIFGVNKVMRDIADSLAEEGYTAVAPDLFWRIQPGIDITDQTDAEWEKAFSYFKAFNVDKGVEDIAATIAWVRGEGRGQVGAVGYCLGGLLAYLTAARTDADASVGYYGVGIDNYLGEARKAKRPVLLHIAEEDGFVSKESQAKMKSAPHRAELHPPLLSRSRPRLRARRRQALPHR
jgi:carboxymethylenebutenolidase